MHCPAILAFRSFCQLQCCTLICYFTVQRVEAKLVKVLSAIQALTDRIDSLESKLSNFEHKYDTPNEKILEQDEAITALENRMKRKVDQADYFDLLHRIEDLEKSYRVIRVI